MSIDNLYPYTGAHAVQNAIFVVEWAEPLRSDELLAMIKLATKYRNLELPVMQQQNAFALNLAVGNQLAEKAPTISHSQELGGVQFSATPTAPGQSRSITITRQNCMVFVPDYTRWATVWNDVQKYLAVALSEIAPARPITVIGLQYTDIFQWKDDPAELPLGEILSRDTFIPPHIFDQKGLWHVHQGFIERCTGPLAHARLDNLNVDMLDNGGLRSIQITASHKATLDAPLWQTHGKNSDQLFELFGSLHAANKLVLAKLLTKPVCDKIKLNGE